MGRKDDDPAAPPGAYSSPVCYAAELDPGYFGATAMIPSDLVTLLNTLLEAERAGARLLAAWLDLFPEGSKERALIDAVRRDEAANCAVLRDLVRHLGGEPSTATGDFLERAMAIPGLGDRLAFLNRGQAWVARKIEQALPEIQEPRVREALHAMGISHRENIAACEELLQALAGRDDTAL